MQLDLFSTPQSFAPAILVSSETESPVEDEQNYALALEPQVDAEDSSDFAESQTEVWLEDLWTAARNGFADKEEWREDQLVYFFTIQETDASDYPGLKPGSRVKLWEDAEGQLCFKVFAPLQELQGAAQ